MTRITENAPWVYGARKTSGAYTGGPPKGVLHATITPSMTLPGYNNQSYAPHQTILWEPQAKRIIPWQHYRFDNFAKALRNEAGGVETNRDTTLQWELAGYLGANGSVVPAGEFDILKAPTTYWEQVADQIGPILKNWSVAPVVAFGAPRFSLAEWDNFSGLCTHAQVPENDHWDSPLSSAVGSLLYKRIWTPTAESPKPTYSVAFPLMSGHFFGMNDWTKWSHSGYYSAADRTWIRLIQARLNTLFKLGLLVDGKFGSNTQAAVVKFQISVGLKKDGKVGINTWRKLNITR